MYDVKNIISIKVQSTWTSSNDIFSNFRRKYLDRGERFEARGKISTKEGKLDYCSIRTKTISILNISRTLVLLRWNNAAIIEIYEISRTVKPIYRENVIVRYICMKNIIIYTASTCSDYKKLNDVFSNFRRKHFDGDTSALKCAREEIWRKENRIIGKMIGVAGQVTIRFRGKTAAPRLNAL